MELGCGVACAAFSSSLSSEPSIPLIRESMFALICITLSFLCCAAACCDRFSAVISSITRSLSTMEDGLNISFCSRVRSTKLFRKAEFVLMLNRDSASHFLRPTRSALSIRSSPISPVANSSTWEVRTGGVEGEHGEGEGARAAGVEAGCVKRLRERTGRR